MLRVEDLIADSEWSPGKTYDPSKKVALTIVLPVHNAASTTLFDSVLESILLQSDLDLELIIVDDNSTDNTREIVLSYMQKDSRISLVSYKRSINIFAISAFSGYEKARGETLIFTSQSFIFLPNSFGGLYRELQRSCGIISGLTKIQTSAKAIKEEKPRGLEFLNKANILVSSAVIIPRGVLESIGLYDPLLLSSYYCQWDLWLRISVQYPIFTVDLVVGSEIYRTLESAELGSTPISLFYVKKIMQLDRADILMPKNFKELILIRKLPEDVNSELHLYLQEIKRFINKKLTNTSSNKDLAYKKKIVIISELIPSAILPFLGLRDYEEFQIIYENISSEINFTNILTASLVIIVRYLPSSFFLIEKLNYMGVPWAYFIDDNFTLLAEEGYAGLYWYSHKNLKYHLSSAVAVLTATKSLQAYYRKYNLHDNIMLTPPIISHDLIKGSNNLRQSRCRTTRQLNVAMIGGQFRHKFFLEEILPALIQLSESINIALWSTCDINTSFQLPNRFTIHKMGREENYIQLILKLSAIGVDLIVHPYGITNNLLYKTDSIVLTARYLHANILVADEPCFKDINESNGILKMKKTKEDIYQQLLVLISRREELLVALIKHCDKYYSSQVSVSIFEELFKKTVDVSACEIERRFSVMTSYFYKVDNASTILFIKRVFLLIKLNGILWFLKTSIKYIKSRVLNKIA